MTAKRIRALFLFLTAIIAATLFAACGSGDLPLDTVDPNAAPANPTYDDVYAIVYRDCAPCHDGEGEGGDYVAHLDEASALAFGGGAEPDLRSCQSIVDNADDMWATIVNNSMPPGAWPRLTEPERLTIKRWIANGAPAPCN